MVETDSSIPSRAYCSLCRLSGWWLAYFSTRIIASRLGPAKPRAITWKGAGGCVIVSQDWPLNFSRTCCVSMWATPLRCPACPQRCRGSNPPTPATQSDLPLTFLRYPENRAVARYFAGEEPVSTDGFGGFNGLRGRCLQAPILTNGFR